MLSHAVREPTAKRREQHLMLAAEMIHLPLVSCALRLEGIDLALHPSTLGALRVGPLYPLQLLQ